MFTGRPSCDCVHGKGQHQLGQGERSLKGVLLFQPHQQTWQQPTLVYGAEKPRRVIRGPFQALSQSVLTGIEPAIPTSQVWGTTKSSPLLGTI